MLADESSDEDEDDDDDNNDDNDDNGSVATIDTLDSDEKAFQEDKRHKEERRTEEHKTSMNIGDVVKLRQLRQDDELHADAGPVVEEKTEEEESINMYESTHHDLGIEARKELEQVSVSQLFLYFYFYISIS